MTHAPRPDPAFPTRYRQRQQARLFFGDSADRYASLYVQSDPLADRLVAWLRTDQQAGAQLFERALREGIGSVTKAPEELRGFFESIEEVPGWVSFDQINRGALAYQRFGLLGMIVLSAWSLLNGYHSSAAVKPLAMTGQLRHNTQRRLAETARFVSEATQVNGLRRGHRGHEISVRVRVIHAHVRHECLASERWKTEEWGLPINQADMFGTLLEFSLLMMDGARRLGFGLTDAEAEAILALWRYCGHLSGVDPWLLEHFESESRTRRMAELLRLIQPGPDEDSLALAEALLEVPGQNASGKGAAWVARFVTRLHHGLARAFNGPEIADDLGVPDDLWQYAEYPARAIIKPLEALRTMVPGASRLAARIGNEAIRRDLPRILRGLEPGFGDQS